MDASLVRSETVELVLKVCVLCTDKRGGVGSGEDSERHVIER